MRGVSYLGKVLNKNTLVEIRRKAMNKGCSSKTLYINSIEIEFSFMGWKPPKRT